MHLNCKSSFALSQATFTFCYELYSNKICFINEPCVHRRTAKMKVLGNNHSTLTRNLLGSKNANIVSQLEEHIE